MSLRTIGCAAAVMATVASTGAHAADPAAGRQKARCARSGHGIDDIAKVPDAPNLAGESAIYTTRQLNAFKTGERQHEQLTIIAQGLSDEDIADLAAWYSSLELSVKLPE